jgi:tripartite-type tricarboxylate transporter receptor subunit TctC
VQRLHQEISQRFPAPDVKQRLAGEGVEVRMSTPAETAKLYAAEYAKWTKVIREAGIKTAE